MVFGGGCYFSIIFVILFLSQFLLFSYFDSLLSRTLYFFDFLICSRVFPHLSNFERNFRGYVKKVDNIFVF